MSALSPNALEVVTTQANAEVTAGGTFVTPDTVVAACSDGASVWTAEVNGWVRQRHPANGQVQHQHRLKGAQEPSCLTVVNGKLWVGLCEGSLSVFRLSDNKHVADCVLHDGGITSITEAFGRVCTAGADGRIALWDPEQMTCEQCFTASEKQPVNCVHFSNVAGALFSNGVGNNAVCWDREGKKTKEYVGHDGPVLTMTVSDGFLWTGSEDNDIRVWSLNTAVCERVINFHKAPVHALLTIGIEGKVWGISMDGRVSSWDTKTHDYLGQLPLSFPKEKGGRPHFVYTLAPISKAVTWQLWACGTDGTVRSWISQAPFAADDDLVAECSMLRHENAELSAELRRFSGRVPFTDEELAQFLSDKKAEADARIADLEDELLRANGAVPAAIAATAAMQREVRLLVEDEGRWRTIVASQAFAELSELCQSTAKAAQLETRRLEAARRVEREGYESELNAERAKREAGTKHLRDSLTEAESRAALLHEENMKTQRELDEARRALEVFLEQQPQQEAEMASLRTALQSRDQIVQSQKIRINELQEERDLEFSRGSSARQDAQKANDEATRREQLLNEAIEALEKEKSENERKVGRLVDQCQSELAACKDEMATMTQRYEDRILLLEASLERQAAVSEAVELDAMAMRSEVAEAASRRKLADQDIADETLSLRAQLEDAKALAVDLQGTVSAQNATIQAQAAEVMEIEELRASFAALQRELRARNDESDSLRTALEDANALAETLRADESERRAAAKGLRERAAHLESDLDERQRIIDNLERAATVSRAEHDRFVAEKEGFSQAAQEAQDRVELLQMKLSTRERAEAALQERYDRLTEKLASAESTMLQRDEEVRKVRTTLSDTLLELEALRDRSAAQARDHEERLAAQDRELDALNAIKAQERDDSETLLRLQGDVARKDAELQNLRQRTAEAEDQMNDERKRNDALDTEVRAMTTDFDARSAIAADQIEQFQIRLNSLESGLSQKRDELVDANGVIESLTRRLNEVTASAAALEDELQAAGVKHGEGEEHAKSLAATVRNQQDELDKAKNLITSLRDQSEEKVQQLNQSVDQLRETLGEKEIAVVGLRETNTKLLAEARAFSDEAEASRDALQESLMSNTKKQRDEEQARLRESKQQRDLISSLQTEVARLGTENMALSTSLRSAETAAAQLEAERNEQAETIAVLHKATNDLHTDLAAASHEAARAADVDELAETNATVISELKSVSARRQRAETTVDELRSKLDEATDDLVETKAKLTSLEGELKGAKTELEAVKSGSEAEKKALQSKITTQQATIDMLGSQLESATEESQAADAGIRALQTANQQRLKLLEEELDGERIARQECEMETKRVLQQASADTGDSILVRESLKKTEERLAEATQRAVKAETEVAATSAKMEALQARCDVELTTLNASTEGLQLETTTLEAELKELRQEKAKFAKRIGELEGIVDELESSLLDVAKRKHAVEAEAADVKSQNDQLRRQLFESSNLIDYQDSSANLSRDQVQLLQDENAELVRKLDGSRQELTELRTRVADVREALESKTADCSSLQTAMQAESARRIQAELKAAESQHEIEVLSNQTKASAQQMGEQTAELNRSRDVTLELDRLKRANGTLERNAESQRHLIHQLESELRDSKRLTPSDLDSMKMRLRNALNLLGSDRPEHAEPVIRSVLDNVEK